MRIFITILLAALLCLDLGSGQKKPKWEVESRDEDYNYRDDDDDDDNDDDDDENDEEDNDVEVKRIPFEGSLECYTCESESIEERCNKIQTCPPSHTFCKTVISKGKAENNFFTTYSAWCSDSCKEATKIIEGTYVTISCCQSDMCNPLMVKSRAPEEETNKPVSCGSILMGMGTAILFMLLCSWLGRDL